MPNTTESPNGDHATGVYQSRLSLSSATLEAIRTEIAGYRREVKSRWGKKTAGQLTDLIAAVLFHDQRPADVAPPAQVSEATIRRWLPVVIDRLARRAPRLDRVLRRAVRDGLEVLLFDCTLVRTVRRGGKANRPNYNGKHKCHGLLFLAVTDTAGNLLWIGHARLGRTSDLTCARQAALAAKLRAHGLAGVGDLAFTALAKDGAAERVAHGVYRLRGNARDDNLDVRAAWLQLVPDTMVWDRTPEQGVVCRLSAAAFHGLGHLPAAIHQFTLPARRQTRRSDVKLYKGNLADDEWTRVGGLLVTRPSRIAADLLDGEAPRSRRSYTDLADMLRMGRLPGCWIAPPPVRELRELVRHRAKLVSLRTGLKCSVHAVLAKCGVAVPMSDLFGVAGEQMLQRLRLAPA